MEIEIPARVVLVEYQCVCGGLMKQRGGEVFLTSPPQYPHKCDSCGREMHLKARYPFSRTVPTDTANNGKQ